MHKPLNYILIVATMIVVCAAAASLFQAQGASFTRSMKEASALSLAAKVASACASTAAQAKLQGSPSSALLVFAQPVLVSMSGRTVSVDVGGASATATLSSPINIAPFSGAVRYLNITASPSGQVSATGGVG